MKRIISTAVIVIFMFTTLVGCATTSSTGEKTAVGAGVGAVLGGIIGYATTGKTSGALAGAAIGGAVGAIAGFAIGKYEDKQLRTKREVYKAYPQYARKPYKLKPDIKKLKPELFDSNDRPIKTVAPGETIKMASEYTVVATPNVDNVEIEENNYLVMPDGTRTPDAIRTKTRDVQRVLAKQTVTLPKELLPGKYTHVAIVKIGNKTEERKQTIEVYAMKNDTRQYASNGVSK